MIDNTIKLINTTQYLYDVEPLHFDNFQYFDAIMEKIELGKKLKRKLTEKRDQYPFGTPEMDLLIARYNEVVTAISYNKALVKERYPKLRIKRGKENGSNV